ncbi:ABC transporter ATP-binding protein [Rufibacter latericius]|uniref:ABC transporter ATP-binding protein n=1 Tax=Rufibacter latericius TaxID=2487040 RepID=A0A3M9MU44_9BACT|nr:ABC transporter ATP-binding protein [Rufibacter latericius]RNI29042.1 ABC transporter ATP-binding protein [Rufibacter latericius]
MIHINNMSFGYRRGALMFQNLHLSLFRGHIYGLLGKNGAGKSTLLKNMIGLAYPTAGICTIDGVDTSKRSPKVLENLYFIPEEIYVPSITTAKFISNTACFYPKFNKEEFYQYLEEFDVPRDSVMDQLSFGQQKKAMIAFGLATNTNLLIMDEPTNGLDIPSKVQFRKIIASALTEERCVIISSHQVRDLESLIDTLLIVHDHEVVVNHELDKIAEKLVFATLPSTEGYEVLYAEESFQGKNAILPNHEGVYSRVDMELLFNAIVVGNQPLLHLLQTEQYENAI